MDLTARKSLPAPSTPVTEEPPVPNPATQPDHLRASFAQSLGATLLMVAVPLMVIWVTTQVLYFRLSTLNALILSVILSLVCAVVLARIWEHRSKTSETSFSELMIWSWYRLQKAERQIEKSLREAKTTKSHDEQLLVLNELTAALESKDPYTRGHSKRVERHSFKTGVALGLPLEEVDVLRMSASLHDVGKIRVPNRVLHKPGALTPEERALIEEHPALGAEMVASMQNDQVVAAVRHHHERWDGGGYPDGIAGTSIPLFSRVIAVSDSYDAIRSNRSYRPGASRDAAVAVLTEESGHQFDPEVVDAFLTTLPARGRAVAAITSLATGPGALWHWVQHAFQRFGSVALAPAIGGAGAAAIIATTSLLGPPLVPPAQATPVAHASPSPNVPELEILASPDPQAVADARAEKKADRLAAQKKKADRLAAQKENRQNKGDTNDGPKSSGTSAAPADPAVQEDPAAPGTNSGDKQPTQEAPTSTDNTSSEPDDSPVEGDPNDEGKDCKDKSSKGSRLHCSS